jgi:hypothetical protein
MFLGEQYKLAKNDQRYYFFQVGPFIKDSSIKYELFFTAFKTMSIL